MAFGDESKASKKKGAAKAAEAEAEAAGEDAAWEAGGKKASKRLEAEAERKAAAAQRKAENKELFEEEEAAMSQPKAKVKKGDAKGKSKLTRAEIAAKAMAAAKAKTKAAAAEKKEMEESGGNEYIGALRANENRSEELDASGVDAAIEALAECSTSTGPGSSKKINLKALYKEFEATQMGVLKEEHPGLKLSQYKERCWQAWQKSPENPMNER